MRKSVSISNSGTIIFCLIFILCNLTSCRTTGGANSIKVVNGKEESGFPFVVQIQIDNSGWCSGSFVSSSLLLTAAHCVHRANVISYGPHTASRESFFIHPRWPVAGADCNARREPQYDIALVRFAPGTFAGHQFSELSERNIVADEQVTIVGYGNNAILPFNTFCRLPEKRSETGECTVLRGVQHQGTEYAYEPIYRFPPLPPNLERQEVGCPVDCSTKLLREQLAAEGASYRDFVETNCEGNFRDRAYRETGLGTKRSGTNAIEKVESGLIYFSGVLAGPGDGTMVASGAGDSGGPMYIAQQDRLLQVGVTHGGSLAQGPEGLRKRSLYVDLRSDAVLNWLRDVVSQEALDFPQFVNRVGVVE